MKLSLIALFVLIITNFIKFHFLSNLIEVHMFEDIWQIGTAIPLLLCSIAAISLILDRSIFLAKQKDLSREQYEQTLIKLTDSRAQDVTQELIASKVFYKQALELLSKESNSEKTIRDEKISTLMIVLNSRLRQRLSALVTVAALAPMLGLLGTIIGLMRAFRSIGEHAGPVEPSLVANGLWQALSTTAGGLIIAVFCIFAHAIFVSKIKKMLTRSQVLLNSLSVSIHQQGNRSEQSQ